MWSDFAPETYGTGAALAAVIVAAATTAVTVSKNRREREEAARTQAIRVEAWLGTGSTYVENGGAYYEEFYPMVALRNASENAIYRPVYTYAYKVRFGARKTASFRFRTWGPQGWGNVSALPSEVTCSALLPVDAIRDEVTVQFSDMGGRRWSRHLTHHTLTRVK